MIERGDLAGDLLDRLPLPAFAGENVQHALGCGDLFGHGELRNTFIEPQMGHRCSDKTENASRHVEAFRCVSSASICAPSVLSLVARKRSQRRCAPSGSWRSAPLRGARRSLFLLRLLGFHVDFFDLAFSSTLSMAFCSRIWMYMLARLPSLDISCLSFSGRWPCWAASIAMRPFSSASSTSTLCSVASFWRMKNSLSSRTASSFAPPRRRSMLASTCSRGMPRIIRSIARRLTTRSVCLSDSFAGSSTCVLSSR